jgi:hypothetical protein
MATKRTLSARAARYVIFNSAFLPTFIGVPLRRALRAKYMARKKTAPKFVPQYVSPHIDEDSMPYYIPRIDL